MSLTASSSEDKSIVSTADMELDSPLAATSIEDWTESCDVRAIHKALVREVLEEATLACQEHQGQRMKVRDIPPLIELANTIYNLSRDQPPSLKGKLPWLGMMHPEKPLATRRVAMVDMIITPEPDRVFADMFEKHYREPKPPPMLAPTKQVNVASDFRREFSGLGARYLQQHLQLVGATHDYNYHYARVVPIIQSSGAGKSKTVVEFARLELGFFVCVRDPPGEQVVSEPPRDEEAIPWLTIAKSDNEGKGKSQTVAIWMESLAIWLESLAIELVDFYTSQWQTLYKEDWPAHQKQDCQRWQEFKITMAKLLSPAPSGTVAPERSELLELVATRCRNRLLKDSIEWSASGQMCCDLKQAWQNLEALLPKETTKEDKGRSGIFHLSIDECGKMDRKLSALKTIFRDVRPNRSFILLLDTNTQISNLAGSAAMGASARAGTLQLMQPFTFLPQDVGMIELTKQHQAVCRGQGRATHDELLQWLPKMGRPLLDDTIFKGDVSIWTVGGINLSEALSKLMCKPQNGLHPDSLGPMHITAVITQRFPLRLTGYNGTVSARLFAEQLVEMHLRRVERILAGGEGILTNCPSEPVLSLAATYAFRWNPVLMWARAIKAIIRATCQYGVVLGDAGEEFVMIVLTAALDGAATSWLTIASTHDGPTFGDELKTVMAPVSVDSWLRHLINDKGLRSNERKAFEAILAWGASRFLNFTQFTVAERQFTQKKPLLHCDLVNAWLRHVAIIGFPGQQGWDIIIPYCSEYKPHDDFVASKVSYIAIQVKNAVKKGDWKADFVKKTIQLHGGSSGSNDDASLLLWFDLNKTSMIEVHEDTGRDTRSKKHIGLRRHLRIGGHDGSTYAVIDKLETTAPTEKAEANLGLFVGSLNAYRSEDPSISDPKEVYDQNFWKGYLPCILEEPATARSQADPTIGQSSNI